AIVGTVEDDRRLGRRPLERRETGDEPAERRHGGKHEHGLAGPEPGPPFNRDRRGARHASLIRSARGTGTGDKTTRTLLLLQARGASRAPARRKARAPASTAARAKGAGRP